MGETKGWNKGVDFFKRMVIKVSEGIQVDEVVYHWSEIRDNKYDINPIT